MILNNRRDTTKEILSKKELNYLAGMNIAEDGGSNLDVLRRIVENKQYEDIKFKKGGKVMVDMQTANVMMTVYNALKEKGKSKFEEMINSGNKADFVKTVNIAWKLVK